MKIVIKSYLAVSLVLFIFGVVNIVYAAVAFTPVADDLSTFDDSAATLNIENLLSVRASGAPDSSCTSQNESFLRFDLSSLPLNSTINTAELVLDGNSSGGTMTMRLWGSNSDTWNEGTGNITQANKPSLDVDLGATSALVGTGNATFSSAALSTFITTQMAGNRIVTLAIRVDTTGTCSLGNPNQTFFSKEGTGADPVLNVTGVTPTAVNLQSIGATTNGNYVLWIAFMLPLILGLLLLIVRRRGQTA